MKPRVLVVGGGPAGAGLALTLAEEGVAALVIDCMKALRNKPGECLTPNFRPLLERLQLTDLLDGHCRIPLFRSRWDFDHTVVREAIVSPDGEGWLLNRRRFEAQLIAAATERGVFWQLGWSITRLIRQKCGWLAELSSSGARRTVEADFVVDATGRSAKVLRLLGEARGNVDRLFGSWLTTREGGRRDSPVSIAADADGWWYCAALPDSRISLVWFSDRASSNSGALLERARRHPLIAAEIGRSLATTASISAHSVSSIRADRVCGPGWFAIGDAAQSFDPISSYGIGSALGTGYYAARALLSSWSGDERALTDYQNLLNQRWLAYLELLAERYSAKHSWSNEPFWVQRRRSVQRAWITAHSNGKNPLL